MEALESNSAEESYAFAESLGRCLVGGEVIALHGDLGAGKTLFVQGLAKGLDVPPEVYVRSPTFALIDQYPGRYELYHLDLYRLGYSDELESIGWRDCLDGKAVVAIEWANRLEDYLPKTHMEITIEIISEDTRLISWKFAGPLPSWYQDWLIILKVLKG